MLELIKRFIFGTPSDKVNIIDPKKNNDVLRVLISRLNRERKQLREEVSLLKQEIELHEKILSLK